MTMFILVRPDNLGAHLVVCTYRIFEWKFQSVYRVLLTHPNRLYFSPKHKVINKQMKKLFFFKTSARTGFYCSIGTFSAKAKLILEVM